MKINYFIIILLCMACFSSCDFRKGIGLLLLLQRYADGTKEVKKARQEEKLTFEEASRRIELYWAITTDNVDEVKMYLAKGYDPNRCMGEEGWMVKTPLNVIARNIYTTFHRIKRGEEIPDPPPDVAILRLLVEAGANVNQRPYIWCRVYLHNKRTLEDIIRSYATLPTGKLPQTYNEAEELKKESEEHVLSFIRDDNRVIEAFLKAGADPDKLGHPYPYSLKAKYNKITDEEADEYFAKGTRPINEAIKKGMWWESQVDLLLQYTALDENSLKAAKKSKDPAMVEKITKLWKEQQGKNGR
ncbi:MAG: hypothetical protein LBU85_01245 [Treponema sp.]|nr:hypothetical protein [Treponema sp.]